MSDKNANMVLWLLAPFVAIGAYGILYGVTWVTFKEGDRGRIKFRISGKRPNRTNEELAQDAVDMLEEYPWVEAVTVNRPAKGPMQISFDFVAPEYFRTHEGTSTKVPGMGKIEIVSLRRLPRAA